VRAQAGEGGSLQPQKGSLQQSTTEGEGVSLGTALLPPDADLKKLESLLFQVLMLPHFTFIVRKSMDRASLSNSGIARVCRFWR